MTVHATFTRRLLLPGAVLAAVAAPLAAAAIGGSPTLTPLAECPVGQTLDPLTGTCSPSSVAPQPITNPIDPEGAQLQPGSITGTAPGEVGRLPEVNGIPCDGANTGKCIGLSENNAQFGNQ